MKDHLKKQDEDGIKRLYVYSQVLMAICGNSHVRNDRSQDQFRNRWKEDKDTEVETLEELKRIKQTQPDSEFKNAIFSGGMKAIKRKWRNNGIMS